MLYQFKHQFKDIYSNKNNALLNEQFRDQKFKDI